MLRKIFIYFQISVSICKNGSQNKGNKCFFINFESFFLEVLSFDFLDIAKMR